VPNKYQNLQYRYTIQYLDMLWMFLNTCTVAVTLQKIEGTRYSRWTEQIKQRMQHTPLRPTGKRVIMIVLCTLKINYTPNQRWSISSSFVPVVDQMELRSCDTWFCHLQKWQRLIPCYKYILSKKKSNCDQPSKKEPCQRAYGWSCQRWCVSCFFVACWFQGRIRFLRENWSCHLLKTLQWGILRAAWEDIWVNKLIKCKGRNKG
jgi:hypothetical protein